MAGVWRFLGARFLAAGRICFALSHWCRRQAAPRWSIDWSGILYHGERVGKLRPGETSASRVYRDAIRQDPCCYCGGPGGTIDHITPRSAGGLVAYDNETGACAACNQAKQSQPLLRFLVVRERERRQAERYRPRHRRARKPFTVKLGAIAMQSGRGR